MTTFASIPAESPTSTAICRNTAAVHPTYAKFLETGLPVTEWKKFEDQAENPTEDLGLLGSTWMPAGHDGSYYVRRAQAPAGEYRREYTPSGNTRSYKTVEKAIAAAAKLNKTQGY